MRKQIVQVLAVAAIFAASPALAQSSPDLPFVPLVPGGSVAPWMNAWVGGGFTNPYQGGYAGFTTATNPQHSLWEDTWLVRVDVGGGKYNSSLFNGSGDTVETHSADFLIGYRKFLPNGSVTVYAGPHYEFHNTDDPSASIRGGEAGIKGVIENEWKIAPGWRLDSGAAYAMAFTTFYAYTQLAYQMPTFDIGPEASIFGNEAPYKEYRVGAFVRFNTGLGRVTLSGGYRDPLTDSPSGYYVNFIIGRDFAYR